MIKIEKSIIIVGVVSAVVGVFSAWNILGKDNVFSESERRYLSTFPELSMNSILNGKFTAEFESYAKDTFPMRDTFRGLKSAAEFRIFQKLDNNGLYIKNGYISRIEYPYNEQMLDYATGRMKYIYDTFLFDKNIKVYFSLIPDKNAFLAENSHLSLDYNSFIEEAKKRTKYMKYIDIYDLLEIKDFYRTDTHWRQERIIDIAKRLASEMDVEVNCEFTENILAKSFKGVYCGQTVLPVTSENIHYLTNNAIDNCKVTSYSKGFPAETVVYNMEKAYGKDSYEIFLSGADPLIIIENPNAKTRRKLVIFRDSFGSSLAPLLIDSYSELTIIDIRYIDSAVISSFVNFENKDVLFIYSTLILNNSLSLR